MDDEDVNNFQPTPPPTTPPPTTKASKHHQSEHRPKRPKPTPVAKLKSNSVKQKKNKDYSGYFVSPDAGREDDLITNEIQSGSLEKNKVQIVSTSIYDPRPKSRSYKNNYNAAYKRGRKSKKYNYRNQVKIILENTENICFILCFIFSTIPRTTICPSEIIKAAGNRNRNQKARRLSKLRLKVTMLRKMTGDNLRQSRDNSQLFLQHYKVTAVKL